MSNKKLPIHNLVADDHVGMLQRTTRAWTQLDLSLQIEAVQNGQPAPNYLQTNKVDILLADYALPNMTGLELMMHIPHERTPYRVFLTGHSLTKSEFSRSDCLVHEFLRKPLPRQRLQQTVLKMIQGQDAQPNQLSVAQKQIVVVDKNTETAKRLAELLLEEGFDTVAVMDEAGLWSTLEENNSDLLLLSVKMPASLLTSIRQHPKWGRLWVVMMGYSDDSALKRAQWLRIGADDWVAQDEEIVILGARLRAKFRR
jgi:CheY-like chemotaxis protein